MRGRAQARRGRAVVGVALATLLLVPAAGAPASAAAPKPTTLRAAGLQASAASVQDGRTLQVRVTSRRARLSLTFTVVRGTRKVATARATVRRSSRPRVLRLRLSAPVQGTGLKLRITARRKGVRRPAAGTIALAVGQTAGNTQTGGPTTPPTTPPGEPPATTPVAPQANRVPSDITLTGTEVTEHEPGPQVVGTLSATDEDRGDTHTFALVGGEGDTDNASFDVIGATLRITAPVDFERQASYRVRVRGEDGRGGTRAEAFTITVRDIDDPPAVRTTAAPLAFREGDAAKAVDPGLTVGDQDDTTLTGAVVAIAEGRQAGDALLHTDANGITGAFDAATGRLTLTGTSSVATYEAALRAVRFASASDAPAPEKAVTFLVRDGAVESAAARRAIAVTPVNDAPRLTTSGGTLSFPERSAPRAVDPALTLTDPDDARITGATVAITAGRVAAEDQLALAPRPGITVATDPATGALRLSGDATVAEYEAALRAVTYRNTSTAPSTARRTITFTATDASGATSAPATRDVVITATDDRPLVTTSTGALAFREGDAPKAVDPGLTVADPEGDPITGATVELTTGRHPSDALEFTPQNGITGAYDASTGRLQLTGSTTAANYQTALRSIRLRITQDDPPATKAVTFAARDAGGIGPAASRTIQITAVNDAPVVELSDAALAYAEGQAAVALDGLLALRDPDSTSLTGAVAELTAGSAAGDLLEAPAPPAGITVTRTSAVRLTFTGTASLASYQAALRGVTFRSTSEDPTAARRTVRVAVDDGGLTGADTRALDVTPSDDLPTAADDTATVLEDAAATAIPVLANDTDPDGGAKAITAVTQPARGAVAITGSGAGLTYRPTANLCGPDSFTYTLNGGSTATVRITVTCVDDAPTAAADRFDAVGNVTLTTTGTRPARQLARVVTGSLLANDTDPDTPAADLRAEPVTGAATARNGAITITSDGRFTYDPPAGVTGVDDTFTYRVCSSAPCTSSTPASSTGVLTLPIAGQVWSVRGAASPGGNGTSKAPFATLAQAEAASGPGDTTVVLQGDGTTTGLQTGYALDADEQLLGEAAGLTLDPDGAGAAPTSLLLEAVAGRRPRITASNEDVLDLAARTRVASIVVDPGGTGGGVAGGAGDAGGTLIDVDVEDTADPAGTQPGLELDGTTGTWSVSGLDVVTRGAPGVRLVNAGTVDLDGPGISTTGAIALDVSGTGLATSALGRITASASPSGGVHLVTTTGSIALGDGAGPDLELTTTANNAALRLRGASGVTVPAAGTSFLRATNGQAAAIEDVTATAIDLDEASSTGSPSEGVLLRRLGTSTFRATSGSLSGTTDAFALEGGSGDITYGGTLANGTGGSLRVIGRTGGTATFSGPIADDADAGGGIVLSGNSGGTTLLSGASKAVSSGAGDALAMTTSDGHTLRSTGGGLVLTTGAGRGLAALESGTLAVTGDGNVVTTTTGRALDVVGTDIAEEGLRFERLSSNGAAGGIRLDRTAARGGLTVTGTTADDSGGTIRSSSGPGIDLADVGRPVSLTRVRVENGLDDGVRATRVAGLTLASSTVAGNGNEAGERGLDLTDVSGTSAIAATTVTRSKDTNARIVQTAGAATWTVSGSAFSLNDTSEHGAHGLEARPSGSATTLKLAVTGSTFEANRDTGLLLATDGGTPQVDLRITGSTVTGSQSGVEGQTGIVITPTDGARVRAEVAETTISRTRGRALVLNPLPGSTPAATFDATVRAVQIGREGVRGSGSAQGEGLLARLAGNGISKVRITSTTVQETAQTPVWLRAEDGTAGTATADVTVVGSTIRPPTGTGFDGILVSSGVTTGDDTTLCAQIGDLASTALQNVFAGTGTGGFPDIRFRQRFSTTMKLAGYSGNDLAGHIDARNQGSPSVFQSGTLTPKSSDCAQPTLPTIP